MSKVPVYNKDGNEVLVITVNDNLTFVSGRASKGESGIYYKGVGCEYNWHSALQPNGYNVLGKSSVFYYGYNVINEQCYGKFGIVQERFQPYFSDFIGSCGPKELKIVENSKLDKSSVTVLDVVNYDPLNKQYYFKLQYDCNRQKYLDSGESRKLLELINWLVSEGWNFPWDKGSINDVSACGRISDVADLFQSKKLQHRFGTVYSILYSLGELNKTKYNEFCNAANLKNQSKMDYIFNALCLLDSNNIDITGLLPKSGSQELYDIYKYVVKNHLITGQNCAYVEDKKSGDKVRNMFAKQVTS